MIREHQRGTRTRSYWGLTAQQNSSLTSMKTKIQHGTTCTEVVPCRIHQLHGRWMGDRKTVMCLFVGIDEQTLKRVVERGFAVSRFRHTSIPTVTVIPRALLPSNQWPPSENSRTTNQTYNPLTISEDCCPQLSKNMIPLKLLFSI